MFYQRETETMNAKPVVLDGGERHRKAQAGQSGSGKGGSPGCAPWEGRGASQEGQHLEHLLSRCPAWRGRRAGRLLVPPFL